MARRLRVETVIPRSVAMAVMWNYMSICYIFESFLVKKHEKTDTTHVCMVNVKTLCPKTTQSANQHL